MPAKQRARGAKRTRRPPPPPPLERQRFRARLLAWYRAHGRDLPWRKTDDPYHILVSEIMLQQTQVDRVLPKYAEWLEKFPTMHALAGASDGEINQAWYPLGYNIRPRRLRRPESEVPRLPDGETVREPPVVVTAAIVERGGRFLLTRRQKGVHLEGFWEFPGGKCDAGETLDACLRRELREELAVDASVG